MALVLVYWGLAKEAGKKGVIELDAAWPLVLRGMVGRLIVRL